MRGCKISEKFSQEFLFNNIFAEENNSFLRKLFDGNYYSFFCDLLYISPTLKEEIAITNASMFCQHTTIVGQ